MKISFDTDFNAYKLYNISHIYTAPSSISEDNRATHDNSEHEHRSVVHVNQISGIAATINQD